MKLFIIGTIILGALVGWAFTRSMDLRCEAYANPDLFPYPTETMKELCHEHFGEVVDLK